MSELFLVVVLVTMVQGGKPVGTASGFFYTHDDSVYFITNRHVLVDETKGHCPQSTRLRLHTDAADLTKNVDREIQLYTNGKPNWVVHPDYGKKPVDIAIIKLDRKVVLNGVVIKALSRDNFLPVRFVIAPGEDLMVIGFPLGVSDPAHNLAIVRSALVSSAYGIDFNLMPQFLVDANLHPGMSGSPVFTRPKNIWTDTQGNANVMTGSPTYFLGIFSATLSAQRPGSQPEALGLGTVWYAGLIDEIIASQGAAQLSHAAERAQREFVLSP